MLGARDALNEGLETVQSRFDTGWGEYSEIGAIWDKQWAAGYITALEDYNASHPETALASAVIELFRSAKKRIKK
ncbi:hypothetical protein ACQKP8_07645 [Photobacterium alginatilyticum]|uniref:hypothetical protein n=1 Tax=Photobacterium alginatilyticum TaxID=1775171 RepID=UPI004069640B